MWRKLSLLVALSLIAVACGSDQESPVDTTTPAALSDFPVTVAGAEIGERPARIVSLNATSTEILFAIGAGDQVVAVDSTSDFPAEAPMTDLSAWEPSDEAIAELEPDLVIIFSDPGDLVSGLEALGVPVITHVAAATLDDAYGQIEEVGMATGNREGAATLIADLRAGVAELVASFDAPETPLTYYHEVDDTLYAAGSATFIGSVYSLFGLTNIADVADDGSGFPQLNAEYIIEADPDIIFYGCALWCGTTAESIAGRPGWGDLAAVRSGNLIELDDDLTSRWGPRLIQFVEIVGGALEGLEAAG